MVKTFIFLGFILQFSYTNAMADRFTDAMEIAIQHYSADASKEITSWGVEHTHVYKALQAIDTRVPGVSRISMGLSTKNFSSLVYQSKYGTEKEKLATEFSTLLQSVEPIVAKCPKQVETQTIENGADEDRKIKTERTTTYTLDSTKCTSRTATALVKAGINQISVYTNNGGWSDSFSLEFSQTVNTYRDMRYVRSQLEKVSNLDQSLLKKLRPYKDEMMIGKSTDLKLEVSNGQAALTDAITLTFMRGWGDCPAGCIHHHYWTIEVKGQGNKFAVEVLKEWGDPLSDKED